jgi:hypothetical protein
MRFEGPPLVSDVLSCPLADTHRIASKHPVATRVPTPVLRIWSREKPSTGIDVSLRDVPLHCSPLSSAASQR